MILKDLYLNQGMLRFKKQGKGDHIVFLHGFGLDSRMWHEQVNHFKDYYSVITYDLRGFGKSSIPEGPYDHVDDLYSLLEYLKVGELHLVGLSMGGAVALDFANKYPKKIKSLTLVGSSVSGFPSHIDWGLPNLGGNVDQEKEKWLQHELFAFTRNNRRVMKKIRHYFQDYNGWHLIHKDLEQRLQSKVYGNVDSLKSLPILAVLGEHDLSYFHECAEYITNFLDQSHLVKLPNVGHMVNMESPDLFNEILHHWLVNCEESLRVIF